MRRTRINPARRDPHLWPGVPVDVSDSAWVAAGWREGTAYPVRIRYLCESVTEGKCWVVWFQYRSWGWDGYLQLVPAWGVKVSDRPDPPPLPEWAVEE